MYRERKSKTLDVHGVVHRFYPFSAHLCRARGGLCIKCYGYDKIQERISADPGTPVLELVAAQFYR